MNKREIMTRLIAGEPMHHFRAHQDRFVNKPSESMKHYSDIADTILDYTKDVDRISIVTQLIAGEPTQQFTSYQEKFKREKGGVMKFYGDIADLIIDNTPECSEYIRDYKEHRPRGVWVPKGDIMPSPDSYMENSD